jgi:hypothetical protein
MGCHTHTIVCVLHVADSVPDTIIGGIKASFEKVVKLGGEDVKLGART